MFGVLQGMGRDAALDSDDLFGPPLVHKKDTQTKPGNRRRRTLSLPFELHLIQHRTYLHFLTPYLLYTSFVPFNVIS